MLPDRHSRALAAGAGEAPGGAPPSAAAARGGGAAALHARFAGLARRWRRAAGAILRGPLELNVDGLTLRFETPADLEFSLAPRTEFPVRKIGSLMELTPEDISRTASGIRQIEKRFSEALARSLQDPDSLGALMRGLDTRLFSQDHGWRALAEALFRKDARFDDYKRVALVKYIQYLGARQQVLQSLYEDKTRSARKPAPRGEETAAPTPTDTAIFDLSALGATAAHTGHFVRLPRAETVTLRIAGEQPLELLLARLRFRLVPGERLYLVDDNGTAYLLRPGRNMVGRRAGNDVVIDPAYCAISRDHVMIETGPAGLIRLTDLSSHGTCIPAACMAQASAGGGPGGARLGEDAEG